jgi:hypothetical protein
MSATRRRSLWMVAVGLVAALALTFTPIGSGQAVVDVGGSASGTGTYGSLTQPQTLTLVGVTGTPEAATGSVTWTFASGAETFTGVPLCISIDETETGFRATIAGAVTGGTLFLDDIRGFNVTVYDNTPPPAEIDQVSVLLFEFSPQANCSVNFPPFYTLTTGDFTVVPLGVCPPTEDDDGDGLTNNNESLFFTLLGNDDSDFDGIADGNDDANGNGDDDEDEDDDEDDECPDEDSDDDGEDDEDEDDEEDDDDD